MEHIKKLLGVNKILNLQVEYSHAHNPLLHTYKGWTMGWVGRIWA
jgi:hypothetical protein